MVDDEVVNSEEDLEDLLYELFELDFDDNEGIKEITNDIYPFLEQNPKDITALIVLMFSEIMQGNRSKAASLANKIWEIGGNMSHFFEMIYIENLLSLGLMDMAMILLKPRFEKLADNIESFYSVLLKFSIITGNVALLRRLEAFPISQENKDIFEYANSVALNNCGDILKNIQKIILQNSSKNLCAYEYGLSKDNSKILDIELYLDTDEQQNIIFEQQINQKIKSYLASANKPSIELIRISVRNIKEHEAWLPDEGYE